jgi:hypothetical protein
MIIAIGDNISKTENDYSDRIKCVNISNIKVTVNTKSLQTAAQANQMENQS